MKKLFTYFQHRRFKHVLVLYVDGELPQHQTTQVRQHLEHCSGCRQKLVDIRACRAQMLAVRGPLTVPTELLWQRIVSRTLALSQRRFKHSEIFSTTRLRWRLAAAMLVFFGLVIWKKSDNGERSMVTSASATIDYGIFLDDLRHNVAEANFYKRYPDQIVELAEARHAIAFPLATIEALPDSFQLDCVRVLECNGVKCIQFTCLKAGKAINIFQHALGQPWRIGHYTATRTPICNVECSLVDVQEVMAVSWRGENSEYLAIGEFTPQEFAQVVQVLQ